MLGSCISVVCMLGIVIVGLLVMTQVIDLEQAAAAFGRAVLVVVFALVALCILKGLLALAAASIFVLLKRMTAWLAIMVFVIVAVLVLVRILISRFEKRLPARGTEDRGEL